MTDTAEIKTNETLKHNRYADYKDSGVEWLGEIPAHWEVVKSKYLWKERIDLSENGDEMLLSVSQYTGVGTRDDGSRTESLVGYKKVQKNDLVINIMLAWLGGLGLSSFSGVVSPAYAVYRQTKDLNPKFLHYLYRTSIYLDEFGRRSKGVVPSRWRMYTDDFGQVITLLAPLTEQTRIAEFLDRKTAQIDQAIAQKERLIELLNERRQVMIHQAITRGLNPDVPMKDSGIEWIGEIPAHWEVKKLKYVLTERNDRSDTGLETMLMMSQEHGLVVRAEYHEKAIAGQTSIGSKKVLYNDLVFNKLKAHLGVFFKSTIEEVGLVSPDYAVYTSNGVVEDLKFLELLFRHPAYIWQFICSATGIVEGLIRLYTGDLFNIRISVPPLTEQKEILAEVNEKSSQIESALKKMEYEIKLLQELKSTLINSAVTGKIKV
ncbi:restriction endonuclease subunit S [Larkinella sp.]|uniref:restriction endonuclease subunit S n=1 Tax=Larkinella sp. TaxID=2034517 RepID=UPI003BA96EFF